VSEPLDELYLQWLYAQVADPKVTRKEHTYWKLFKQLYVTEFVWTVPNDDNRVEDGKALRIAFAHHTETDIHDPSWMSLGCSMLELILGLSHRLSFEAEGEPDEWFWLLITNVELHFYNDDRKYPREEVAEILDRIIWRKYDYNGLGGLFPLNNPVEDQREKELWYQMQAYVIEHI
jgi:hypothetical protein